MKKIFPVIVILISLSLVGLIFFQFLWLRSARDNKVQELGDKIRIASLSAGEKLVKEKSILSNAPDNQLLIPTRKMKIDFFARSVSQRFTKEEIQEIIRTELSKQGLNVPFEFAIGQPETQEETVITLKTDRFLDYFNNTDTSQYTKNIILLTPDSGTYLENLTPNEVLVVIVPSQNSLVKQQLSGFVLAAIIFTLIIISAFFLTLRTLFRQKKLSEIKNDFINNMTHEFKTPLATISLAVDALRTDKVKQDEAKANYFISIIKEENKRMNKQVETILQAAQLDKQEIHLNLHVHHAHEMIQNAINNISLPIAEKGGQLIQQLNATNDLLELDEVHFTNFVNNLLENAVKYSKENVPPVVKLTTYNEKNNFKIRIEDNGIGMNKETINRIFEKFYRAHTGNVHNVKGFGLGLSYVKTMVEAHKGTIRAESTLGKGSCFTLSFHSIKK